MILTNNRLKYIRSLKDKKNRDHHKTFVAEGDKLVGELLNLLDCQILLVKDEFLANAHLNRVEHLVRATDKDIARASFQRNPQNVLAVFYQPQYNIPKIDDLCLALDAVQDPGNLGTIIRLADWYGIKNVFCSLDTADIYNPKVVQASMGALARVRVHYLDLQGFLAEQTLPIYGALLDGKDIYEHDLKSEAIIVMGNEGKGIRPEIEALLTDKILIPSYPKGEVSSESLNVAVATAVVCAEFRRRKNE